MARTDTARWIDLDVFLMSDPTPAIVAHAEWKTSGPKGEILLQATISTLASC